ncbi:FUSC family protein [Microlunatus soli]|uniref:Cyclic nucleotide-binding domain-containing protein n=1 Tax=Microlunatus soli TaxID=630515 RepID=A0A1H1N2B5_9ACTN|nr:hypothetical protein [Microlunatus soli]SDR93102.1 hypothetical protein SAMN04489812_0350 [Microlunatus soli]
MAIRTAIAGGLAWWVAQLLPGSEPGRYAYFAPMGAVVVTSTSVAATFRELLRSVAALAIGAGLGSLALLVTRPDAFSVAAIIVISVLIAGWSRLGSMRGWVPTVAVLTLVLGVGKPLTYASAYTGLTGLGAGIAATVVVLLPQLVIEPMVAATRRLLSLIINNLQQIQDDLERTGSIGSADGSELETALAQLGDRLRDTEDSGRANLRRRRSRVDDRLQRARAVRALAERLQYFRQRLAEHQSDDRGDRTGRDASSAAGGELARLISGTIALVLRALRDQDGEVDLEAELDEQMSALDEAVQQEPYGAPGLHTASSTVYELRRLGLAARAVLDAGAPWD